MNRELIRRRIQGLEGPYECVTIATDALDNVRVWIKGLTPNQQTQALELLIGLMDDDDPIVATGAVLALDFFDRPINGLPLATFMLSHLDSLQRPPTGFQRISDGRLFQECFSRLCTLCSPVDAVLVEQLWKSGFEPREQSDAMFLLAAAYPDLVVYHAATTLKHDDVHVLCALKEQWQRIAVAGALRIWPDSAIHEAEKLMRFRHVDAKDMDAVIRVMKDDYPALTQPCGLNDYRKWWIVAGLPWQWTAWEASDGTLAIEVQQDGPGELTQSRLMSASEVAAFRERRSAGIRL